jgi:hypothetical protein
MALPVIGSGRVQRCRGMALEAYTIGYMMGNHSHGSAAKTMRHARLLIWVLAVSAAASAQSAPGGRIVAVGDVHGDFDAFVTVLRAAGVIDGANKWSGGATTLVQTGDILDRGTESRKVLDLLIALEKQAERAKGKVHALLGNHEAMNVYGDLRYVSPEDFNSYKTADSAAYRDRVYEALSDPTRKDNRDYRKKWYDEHPLGWAEQRQAFASNGKYGRVLLEHDAIVKVNDILFLHGGFSAKFAGMPIATLNRRIRAELKDFRLIEGGLVTDKEGPLWDRGLAEGPESPETAGLVASILAAYGVSHIVLGHTPTAGAVVPRFGGKVLLIDVGLSKSYNSSPACLIVEDGNFYALHRGVKIPLPDGIDPAEYLRRAAAIDPPGTDLRKSLGIQ